jgi:C-terminal processing protease CtpA/Prc
VSARTSRYPIVRHTAFFYGSKAQVDYSGIEQDHELLKAFLAETPHLAGVLLDLRDNAGGHHSDQFLPWYLSGKYPRTKRWVRLDPRLTDRARLNQALWSSEAAEEYVRRAATGAKWWLQSFKCDPAECPPMPKPLVTTAPIAVLVGPSCRSSCDTFVNVWSERHAGPTIGEPAAAMLTSIRYPLDVRLGDESLGQLTIALSGVRASERDAWLEGKPLPVDELVTQSWPAAEYEQKMIDAAIRALESGKPSASGISTARAALGR